MITLQADILYAAGCQPFDSVGEPYSTPLANGMVTARKTIEFVLPFMRGVSSTSSVASLSGMTEDLTKKANKTYSYTANNEYLVFAYDAAYGELKSILDQNGFENIDSFNRSTLTYESQSYYVYVSANAVTDTGASFTFKF